MASYVKSIFALTERLNQEGITWAWSCEYSSHVADAREMTLSGTNHNIIGEKRPFHGNLTYDKLMWIDSDIAFTPEDVLKLYRSDKEIISGCYLLASGEVVAYPKMLYPAYGIDEIQKMSGIQEVEGVGFGFLCISQGIFEQMTRPWFQQVMMEKEDTETGEVFTFPLLGEDLSWCERARRLGYKIWLDTDVKVIHHKTMKLTWEGIKV
jgi:GT2 family glycosyltransferase